MNREDTRRGISALVRQNHSTAMFAIGWMAQEATLEQLSDLLEALQWFVLSEATPNHLEAYKERWGRLPAASKPPGEGSL